MVRFCDCFCWRVSYAFLFKSKGYGMNELLLIILGCLSLGIGLYIQDWRHKRQEQKLSDRLYQAENNINYLKNLNNGRRKK